MSTPDADGFVVDVSGPPPPAAPIDAGVASPPASVAVPGDASPDSVSTPAQASSDDDLPTSVTSEPTDAERTPDGRFAKKGSIQARIDQATYEKHEAQRQRDALAARLEALERAQQPNVERQTTNAEPTASTDRPKIDDFTSYEEWVEAVADWRADQKLEAFKAQARDAQARQQREATMQAHTGRVQAFAEKTPDYFEVIGKAGDLPLSAALQEVLVTSENGPALAYYLATHQEEALRLAQETASLPATAAPLVRQLLETKLSSTASSGPVAGGVRPSVPAPIKPVGAAPVVTERSPDELEFGPEYVARMNKREREQAQARNGY